MKVHFLTSPGTWFLPHIENLLRSCRDSGIEAACFEDHRNLPQGDLLFILSYYRLLPAECISRHRNNVVIHASDLPRGKGCSPLAWQILEGSNDIVFTLFEAVAEVDAGPVYLRDTLHLEGNELYAEWRRAAGLLIEKMTLSFLAAYPNVHATPQEGESSFFPKRTREDDRIDLHRPLAELFDHLRICDADNFPAWFEFRGRKFKIGLEPL